MEKKRTKTLDNRGVAMLMVLIVSAVVMVFCLSLLLVTYSLFAQTSRQTTRLQCKLYAQSCAETLKEELADQNSELMNYLHEQIKSGYWLPENASYEEGETPEGVEELSFHLDSGEDSYVIGVFFTYSQNVSEEEDAGEEDDEDDQDADLNSSTKAEDEENGLDAADGSTGASGSAGSKSDSDTAKASAGLDGDAEISYTVLARIRCTRGDGSDRDTQYYELETEFPAVTF